MTRLLHPLASALRQGLGTLLALVFLASFAHAQAEIEFFEVDALNPGLPADPDERDGQLFRIGRSRTVQGRRPGA